MLFKTSRSGKLSRELKLPWGRNIHAQTEATARKRDGDETLFRPEMTVCLTCQTPLRRDATLSQRTVITLNGPVRLIHRGYSCFNAARATRLRSYRSAAADALALPGFTFGVDLVIRVGHLRLCQHQTLDEVH